MNAKTKKKETLPVENKNTEVGSIIDYSQYAGAGSEAVTIDDLVVPFLKTIQKLSKQLERNHELYLEEANEGDFYNTATQELYPGDKGIVVVPVDFSPRIIEWDISGGGVGKFVEDLGTDKTLLEDCTRGPKGEYFYETDKGNKHQLRPTGTHYVLLVDEETGSVEQAIMSLAGSQKKTSNKWNNIIKKFIGKTAEGRSFAMPSFARPYRITTIPLSNDDGNWYGMKIEPLTDKKGVPVLTEGLAGGAEIIAHALSYLEATRAGTVKAADPGLAADDEGGKEADAF